MSKDDRLEHGPFAGLTQGSADLLAAAQHYGADWAGGLGRQVLEAGRRAQQAQKPIVRQVVRKATAAPYTGVGAVLAGPEILGALAHGRLPGFKFGDNALQITNVPTLGNRAYTLGNLQFYPPGRGPDHTEPSYSHEKMRIGDHEAGHSDAMEENVLYGLKWIDGGGWWNNKNPEELDADRRGLARARRRPIR